MKALRTLTILFALALMCLPAPSAAAAEKPFKLDICAMPEHESFIFWYAKEQGWDKDEGLDFQIHFFQTGMDQLEALPAKQWVVGGTGTVPILVGDKAFCDAHPDIVVKFLRVWLRGVNMIKKEIKNPKLAEQYHRFWTEWAGQDIEPQMAKMDLEYHPVFDIDQQLAIFDDSKGPSQVEQWQDKVLDFFASQGRFSPEEVKKIRGSGYINGTFLKMAAESIKEKPLGGYKLD